MLRARRDGDHEVEAVAWAHEGAQVREGGRGHDERADHARVRGRPVPPVRGDGIGKRQGAGWEDGRVVAESGGEGGKDGEGAHFAPSARRPAQVQA
ncbi:hypothetical protein GCM10023085_39860 [Actinomadura viridis]